MEDEIASPSARNDRLYCDSSEPYFIHFCTSEPGLQASPSWKGLLFSPRPFFLILNSKPNGGTILAISNPSARIKKHSATNSPFSDRG